ncbi:hypothetical protein DFJ74DRAFT_705489 [Hyaloraphidium curvatum]|nr:hypothetical protein DFJ74DRAFT_705489 [Hyaloraphidium curvatum]
MALGSEEEFNEAPLRNAYTTYLADFEKLQSAEANHQGASSSAAAAPNAADIAGATVPKPLYLPFRRDVAAENGGYDPALLEGEVLPRTKKLQKEEFGSVDLMRIGMHLRSGQNFEMSYGLNVLTVISAEMDVPLVHTPELVAVMFELWQLGLGVLRELIGAVEDGSGFDYDWSYRSAVDGLAVFRLAEANDPTDERVKAGSRVLAITDAFRNLSFSPENQKYLGKDAGFLSLLVDTLSLKLPEPEQEGMRGREPLEGRALVLELHKNMVTLLSNIAGEVKLSSPFAASRVLRFMLGFLGDEPNPETELGPYSFPALEAFAKICLLIDNRELLAWNSELLGLEAWIPRLARYLTFAAKDFSFTPQRLAVLELALMALYNLSSLNEELRRTVIAQPGAIQNLFSIAMAGNPGAVHITLGLQWTMVRAKAAQILRELARSEASHATFRTFEYVMLALLMDYRSQPTSEERTAVDELVTAFHGILFSLQLG